MDAQSNFVSVRADVAVFEGKWQYECVILSGGLAQVGWSTLDSKFTEEMGVGDFPNSYAYDGQRRKKWAISAKEYGREWAKGDVIGVLWDAEGGTVSFTRNGEELGVAFEDVRLGKGLAFFPTVSLAQVGRAAVLCVVTLC